MKILQKAVGKTRQDKSRNEVIREMGMEPVTEYIGKQRLKWFGHLMRMPWNQLAFGAYNVRSSAYKAHGRPRKRFKSVKEQLRPKREQRGKGHTACNQEGRFPALCFKAQAPDDDDGDDVFFRHWDLIDLPLTQIFMCF